jgi:hypothetical protein
MQFDPRWSAIAVMLECSPVFWDESHISLTLLAVVTKKGGSGRTVTNRLFGLHSLAIPIDYTFGFLNSQVLQTSLLLYCANDLVFLQTEQSRVLKL